MQTAPNPEEVKNNQEINTEFTNDHQLTPKEQYDQEMQNVSEHKATQKRKNMSKEETELQDEMDEISDEVDETFDDDKKPIDKSMGETKIVVTREQHLENRKNIQDQLLMKRAQVSAKHSQNHLTTEELLKMKTVLIAAEAGEVTDKILIHLIKRKVTLSEQYIVSNSAATEKHKQWVKEMATIAEAITKCKGAIENVDKEIFSYIEETGIEFK